MDRGNHYERAFEAYLQMRRLCYVAVDETRRAPAEDGYVKCLDFVVYGENGSRLLVDVKGRRFPAKSGGKERRVWECWSTRDDIDGLEHWKIRFGHEYHSLLVFTYLLGPAVELPEDTDDLWHWRGRRYLFRAVPVDQYRKQMRVRSPKWNTVTLARDVFRQLVRPLHHFTHGPLPVADQL